MRFCFLYLLILSGFVLGAVCESLQPDCHTPQWRANAQATRAAHRLMECFGDGAAWECRPAGVSQADIAQQEREYVVRPVVTIIDGRVEVVN